MTWCWRRYHKMENPIFHLEGVVRSRTEAADFDGPLSLILMLLSSRKIEIRDVRISDILDQYLAYLDRMQRLDLEIASEFVQMASYLLYIKTRTILEGEEQVEELEQLKDSLEQLRCREIREALAAVTPRLAEASRQGFLRFTRGQEPLPRAAREYEYRHDPGDLLRALGAVFSRGARPPAPEALRSLAPRRIVYAVQDKCRELVRRLRAAGKATLRELYRAGRSRSELVATFISVLELCAAGSLAVEGEAGDYVISLTGVGNPDAVIESMEKQERRDG